MIWKEYKKTIMSPVFWLSTILFFFVLLLGDWESLEGHGELLDGSNIGALYVFQMSVNYGIGKLAIMIFSILPCAYLYLEEANGYQKYYMIRGNVRDYIVAKIMAAVWSAVTLVLLSALSYICFLLIWMHGWGEGFFLYDNTIYESWQTGGHYGALFILDLLTLICWAVEWPVATLALSTFTHNKYIVITVPFLLTILLNFIGEWLQAFWLQPSWIGTASFNVYTAWGGWRHTLLYLAILVGISAVIFVVRIRRTFLYG